MDTAVWAVDEGVERPCAAADNARPLRVLVMSHSHPALSKGGAEIAAYQHFTMLKTLGHEAVFIASGSGRVVPRDGVSFSQELAEDEYLYSDNRFDHFIHGNLDSAYPARLKELLSEIRPDVVHLHHYTNFGVETLLHIRSALPACKIIVTLHEYLAICHHMGQMVKTGGFGLCDASGYRDCAKCFPEKSEQDFFLREIYVKRFFDLVDHFVAPSAFLRGRYVAWGLPETAISVVENGLPLQDDRIVPPRDLGSQVEIRIGYFGQISVLKGIHVVIDAAKQIAELNESGVRNLNIRFCVFGDHSGQPPGFPGALRARPAIGASIQLYLHGALFQCGRSEVDGLGRCGACPVDLVGKLAAGNPGSVPGRAPGDLFGYRGHGREGPRRAGRLSFPGRQLRITLRRAAVDRR